MRTAGLKVGDHWTSLYPKWSGVTYVEIGGRAEILQVKNYSVAAIRRLNARGAGPPCDAVIRDRDVFANFLDGGGAEGPAAGWYGILCPQWARCWLPAPRTRRRASIAVLLAPLIGMPLGGCDTRGAPSYVLFGAYFPAWMFLALLAIIAAIVARALFLATGLARVLPFQLFVCAAVGVSAALLAWSRWFEQ